MESILNYVAIKVAKTLIEKKLIKKQCKIFWNDFFAENGLQSVSDYESFVASKKSTKENLSIAASLKCFLGSANSQGNIESQEEEKPERF